MATGVSILGRQFLEGYAPGTVAVSMYIAPELGLETKFWGVALLEIDGGGRLFQVNKASLWYEGLGLVVPPEYRFAAVFLSVQWRFSGVPWVTS